MSSFSFIKERSCSLFEPFAPFDSSGFSTYSDIYASIGHTSPWMLPPQMGENNVVEVLQPQIT
jgi:hypothetical protein